MNMSDSKWGKHSKQRFGGRKLKDMLRKAVFQLVVLLMVGTLSYNWEIRLESDYQRP